MLGKENHRATEGFQFDLWKVEVPNFYKGLDLSYAETAGILFKKKFFLIISFSKEMIEPTIHT